MLWRYLSGDALPSELALLHVTARAFTVVFHPFTTNFHFVLLIIYS